jgi:hypothetical protein
MQIGVDGVSGKLGKGLFEIGPCICHDRLARSQTCPDLDGIGTATRNILLDVGNNFPEESSFRVSVFRKKFRKFLEKIWLRATL